MPHIELAEGLPTFGSIATGEPKNNKRLSFEKLNSEQKLIASDVSSKVTQVIAGAGCGKTTGAILPRAQALYYKDPGTVVILAFNVSVKEELEEKIQSMLDPVPATKVKALTLAGLSHRLVMSNLEYLNLPAKSELITEDWKIIKFLKEQIELETSKRSVDRFPRFQPIFNKFSESQIKAIFKLDETAVAQGVKVSELYKKYEALSTINEGHLQDFIFWNRAVRLLNGKLMWRDLLPLATALPDECYANLHFKHVLVDEAQDLSVEQHAMIAKLEKCVSSLTFVGDPSQCIYKFSGSRPDLFMNISKQYPNTKVFYLQTNYRSDQSILDAANYILKNILASPITIKTPYEKVGQAIKSFSAENTELIKWVKELIDNGMSPNEIGVLARINAHMLDLEIAFSQAGIPYECWSGSFFEHTVVSDIMALLKTAYPDPEHGVDQEDWETVVGHTKFLGKKTAEESWNRSPGDPLKNTSTPSACRSHNQKNLWDELIFFIKSLQRLEIQHAIMQVFNKLIVTWEQRWADDPSKIKEANEVSQAFMTWARTFKNIPELIDASKQIKGTRGGVTLSTVHKFKGLERDCIALWKVGSGFPMQYERADKEEEACIFYVALTRARHVLGLFLEAGPGSLPYNLKHALCPEYFVIPEVLSTYNPPDWGAYDACKLCSKQLQCLAERISI